MRDLPAFARFWMVCRKPDSLRAKTEPRHRFSLKADAIAAAEKLAAENGQPFLILEAVAVCDPGAAPQRSLL